MGSIEKGQCEVVAAKDVDPELERLRGRGIVVVHPHTTSLSLIMANGVPGLIRNGILERWRWGKCWRVYRVPKKERSLFPGWGFPRTLQQSVHVLEDLLHCIS